MKSLTDWTPATMANPPSMLMMLTAAQSCPNQSGRPTSRRLVMKSTERTPYPKSAPSLKVESPEMNVNTSNKGVIDSSTMQTGALGRPCLLKISAENSARQSRYAETERAERCEEAV